jgi:hypothetical protein
MRKKRTERDMHRSLLVDGKPPGIRMRRSPERKLVRDASWMPRFSSTPFF